MDALFMARSAAGVSRERTYGPGRFIRSNQNGPYRSPWAAIQEEFFMNWDRIEGNWKQFRGQAQQQWGKLTNDDLEVVEGRRQNLVGKIQERYGIAKDEAERQVDTWLQNM
jgi:uncharacterized protein YjbJ (UPF0337 family)